MEDRAGLSEGVPSVTTPAAAAKLLRSRSYWALLAIAAVIGIPISALAYFFLDLVSKLQHWTFVSLPDALGFHGAPLWWPVPPLLLSGLLVALTIRYLPGRGGHSPADGLSTKGARRRPDCPAWSWPRWPPWPWAPCSAPRPR